MKCCINQGIIPGNMDYFNWSDYGILNRQPGLQTGQSCSAWVGCETVEANLQLSRLVDVRLNQPEPVASLHIPTRLSIQHLLDCCIFPGNANVGGYVSYAYWFMQEYGIASYSQYPLVGHAGQVGELHGICLPCTTPQQVQPVARITGYNDLSHCNEYELMFAVRNYGPIAVGLTVGEEFTKWRSTNVLSSGIYNKSQWNGATIGGHYLILMGFGMLGRERYWLLRNSYGTGWGDNGYVRLNRDLTTRFEDVWIPRGAYRV